MKLLIVESPTKAKKITPMLGAGWRVQASAGHVRDLPVSAPKGEAAEAAAARFVNDAPGVLRDTYELVYEVLETKRDVVARLRDAAKSADVVYLATDPDREGEAIAWHIAETLHLRGAKRVTFNEITKPAVLAAVAAPREIDVERVRSQEGRRALDRLVGYRVGSLLRRRTGRQMTAGRVQTVAVLLVVDRELEIRAFSSRQHYAVILTFEHEGKAWTAEWDFRPFLPKGDDREKLWLDRDVAQRVAKFRDVHVVKCGEEVSRTAPPAPFTTTTMVQAASNALRFKTELTMQLAQSLFQKGLITYHRTDYPNLSAEAIDEIRAYAVAQRWPLPATPRKFKSKAGAQEAHEAIRPTHVDVADPSTHETVSAEERKLYELIRTRAIASQLADAEYDVRTVVLEARERLDGQPVVFIGRGRTVRKPGFRVVLAEDQAEEKEPEAANPVPALGDGTELRAVKGVADARKTKPPARYTEATLVKALEAKGVGRPSTYATILSTIQKREYVVESKDRKFSPTPIGETLIEVVRGRFAFADVLYTALMESELDAIAAGKRQYRDVVSAVNESLDREIARFDGAALAALVSGPPCTVCGTGILIARRFKGKGRGAKAFAAWTCGRYPECTASFADEGGAPAATPRPPRAPKPDVDAPGAIRCPKCKKDALVRRESAYGGWYGCAGYPKCDARFPERDGQPDFTPPAPDAGACPKCKKGVLRRRDGARGPFWGCSKYPKCKYVAEDDGNGKPLLAAAS